MITHSPLHPGRHLQTLVAAAIVALTAAPASARECSPVMEWNKHALDATVTALQGALPQIRSLALVHASIHDALNSVERKYQTYLPVTLAPAGASADAAVIGAAHHALVRLFGPQAGSLNTKRTES